MSSSERAQAIPISRVVRDWLMGRCDLDDATWERRHEVVLSVLALHIPVLLVLALFVSDTSVIHDGVDLLPMIALSFLAWQLHSRRLRELSASLGMLFAAAAVVHLGGGLVELHFHFFLALTLVSLYQSRTILAVAVMFTFVHHFALGVLAPNAVWSNSSDQNNEWQWALLHAFYVAAVGLGQLVFWRNTDEAKRQAEESYRKLWEGEQAVSAQLRAAELIKDELVAVVSHEFRTPLTSVLGFAHLLRDHPDNFSDKQRDEYLGRIVDQSERLSRLVDNLLSSVREISDYESGDTDVEQVMQQVVAELSPLIEDVSRISVHAGTHRRGQLSADALHQVLVNLLANALKFSPSKSVISVRSRDEDRDHVAIEVTNQMSRRLSEREIERLFEPFVRLETSDAVPTAGLGLGLAIVRRLVAAREGSVHVTVNDHEITFTVTLSAIAALHESESAISPV